MGILKWGKPTVEISLLGANGMPTEWIVVDTPVENTTKVVPTKGDKKEAKEEGGDLVDVRNSKNNYTLEFELYSKRGKDKPVEDNDGLIDGEYAVRITPEDDTLPGKIMDRVTLCCEDTFDSENGEKWKYTGDVLKPATGNKVKPYIANRLTVTPAALYFANTADSSGKTINVTSTANPTATSSDSWCTVTTATKVVTVKVTANTESSVRIASITITADGKTSKVMVTQIPA